MQTKKKKYNYFTWIVFYIFLLSIILRIVYLTYPSDMWHDPAFTYSFSKMPVEFILSSNDVHPPLYTLIMKCFFLISTDEIFIRLTSVLFWVLFFFATLRLVSYVYNKRVAWITLLFLSVSPTMIYYSVEPRNYMLGMFFVVMQLYYFFAHLKDGWEGRTSWQFILFSVLMLYTHYYTGLLLVVEGLFLLKTKKERIIGIKNYLIISIFSIPLLYYLALSLPKIQEFWFKEIGLNSLVSSFTYQFVQPESLTSTYLIVLIIISGIILFSLSVQIKDRWFAYALFIIPVLIIWLISQLSPMYHHRFFLFFALGLYLVLAQVIDTFLDHPLLKIVGICMIVSVFLMLGNSYNYMKHNPTDDLFQSQQFMKTKINMTDKITFVHVTTFSQTPYKYYFRDYPNVKQLLITNLTKKQLFTAGGSVVKPDEIINSSQLPQHFYYITDTLHFKNESDNIIYDKGGLIIWVN